MLSGNSNNCYLEHTEWDEMAILAWFYGARLPISARLPINSRNKNNDNNSNNNNTPTKTIKTATTTTTLAIDSWRNKKQQHQ